MLLSEPIVPVPEEKDASAAENHLEPATSGATDLLHRSICAVSAAAYCWDIESDKIEWNGDTGKVFGEIDTDLIATGRGFASLLDPENITSRFETVVCTSQRDEGEGVGYSIEYSMKPFGRDHEHSIWLEDNGRWYAGTDGRAVKAYGVVRQIDDRHQRDQHLQFMGNCDPLTGMMNRGRLTEALGETIALAKAQNHESGFLIVSISNLAVVSNAYGFDVADDVVMSVGKRLRQVTRTGDVIGRYSSSKFGLILARATPKELEVAAERFLSVARENVIETDSGPVWAMLSIGGLTVPYDDADSATVMSRAEEALYEAMRVPGDGFVAYRPSANVISERKLNSRSAIEIVHGLKENRFRLAYQPIISSKTGEVALHEALLRLACDNDDVVPAGHLIPIAEKLGLIRLIDRAVVHTVLNTLRAYPTVKLALNISGVTANDPRWFAKIMELLQANQDVTDRLTVEFTETVALENIEQTVEFIDKLRELGCKVAIDDFGAGFTSFSNLKVLNVDKVKIDGSFCKGLASNVENQYFVRALVDLAKKFDLEVVAEWVEHQADADLLVSWGVDYLQGHLYGKAVDCSTWGEPVAEFANTSMVPCDIRVEGDEVDDNERQGVGANGHDDQNDETKKRFDARGPDNTQNGFDFGVPFAVDEAETPLADDQANSEPDGLLEAGDNLFDTSRIANRVVEVVTPPESLESALVPNETEGASPASPNEETGRSPLEIELQKLRETLAGMKSSSMSNSQITDTDAKPLGPIPQSLSA